MRTDSPEDRLLRLIKGKYKKKEPGATTGQGRPATNTESFLTDVSKKIFLKNKRVKVLFSDTVNKVLVGILIAVGLYFAYSLLFPAERNIEYIIRKEEAAPVDTAVAERGEPLARYVDDYSVYSRRIGNRDLFTAPLGEEGETGPKKAPEIDIAKRFNLVGIISGDEPQAIIEDREGKKTHYLYEGQSINGVTVLEIAEGRVVLDYDGKEVMLVL